MSENSYKHIIDQFLSREIDVDTFIDKYFAQWKSDRDAQWESLKSNPDAKFYDPKFQRMIDRIFTSCDSYDEKPEKPFEISEEELRKEVELFRHLWWG